VNKAVSPRVDVVGRLQVVLRYCLETPHHMFTSAYLGRGGRSPTIVLSEWIAVDRWAKAFAKCRFRFDVRWWERGAPMGFG
jgi:hypothetical protein